jgi:hypothetical protein
MERLGSQIESKFCDKMQGSLDGSATYSSNDLINAVRNNPECKFVEVIHWVFGGADWVGDTTTEDYVTSKINQFVQQNPSPTWPDYAAVSCTSEQCKRSFYIAYAVHATEEEKEVLKNALLDVFIV